MCIMNKLIWKVDEIHTHTHIEDYIQKHDGGLITAIRNDTDNTMDNN